MAKQQESVRIVSDPNKLLEATEKVTAALLPLSFEDRTRVLKAIVILFDLNITID